ncbi:MAG TPA: hypothetical protein VMF67_16660 [Rhizomicrobium sp.]|nr:hypothetical protein [Rhizomicrobium sp.]
MKTRALLTTMLAGASVCAISTAAALAAPPNIHMSAIFETPVRLDTGVVHFKTNMADRIAHNASTITTTVTLTGTISSDFSGLLYAFAPYSVNKSGKCVQPTVKQTYSKPMNGKVRPETVEAKCPTGKGRIKYYGPHYKVTNHDASSDSFTGEQQYKTEGYEVHFFQNVYLKID